MKKVISIIIVIMASVLLVSCKNKGDVTKVEVKKVDSDIFSSEEIDEAIDVVIEYFEEEYYNRALLTIRYVGDDNMDQLYDGDSDKRRIYLESGYVYTSKTEFALKGETVSNWTWTLERESKGEKWKLVSGGYW